MRIQHYAIKNLQVSVHLKLELDWTTTGIQLYLHDQLYLTVALDEDIQTVLNDQLAPFINFKLDFTISDETVMFQDQVEEAYLCLNQLLHKMWRPNGSLIHSASLLTVMECDIEISRKLLAEIIQFFIFPPLPLKLTCNTLRLNYDTLSLEDLSGDFFNFENTKKIIFEDTWVLDLGAVVVSMAERGERLGKLEEIDVTMHTKHEKIVALAALRGLKRLIIRIADLKMMEDIMAELKECIAKHAPTLEFLHLDFMTTTTISSRLCKFVPLEFLKLKRLYLEAYLTYVGVGDHDLDIFGLNEIVEDGTLNSRFPVLKRLEIVERPKTRYPILKNGTISELRLKYGVQVV
ncbi:hypothetical protein Fcan01_25467 [Folsomia candida]|uniref:Uncharacterized protein n=1 Tax=Folsomia candida TaxID=158441 RepID=A0A226D640_FOLCA|nr:hypothetical protein Fcan01_25467 [Folsomia candida]